MNIAAINRVIAATLILSFMSTQVLPAGFAAALTMESTINQPEQQAAENPQPEAGTEPVPPAEHDSFLDGNTLSAAEPGILETDLLEPEKGEEDEVEAEVPAGVREAIAAYLGIRVEDITSLRYKTRKDVFCLGTGCATYSGYLDLTANVNGQETHYAGSVVGGWFDTWTTNDQSHPESWPYYPVYLPRLPEVYLIETELSVEAVASLAIHMGKRIEDIAWIRSEQDLHECNVEGGCGNLWNVDIETTDGNFFKGTLTQLDKNFTAELTQLTPEQAAARHTVMNHLLQITGLDIKQLRRLIASIEVERSDLKAGEFNVIARFQEGQMADGRLLDVLGDGKMFSHAEFRLTQIPSIQGITFQLVDGKLIWDQADSVTAANLNYIEGILARIFWTRDSRDENGMPQRTELYDDVYEYTDQGVRISRTTELFGTRTLDVLTLERLTDKYYVTQIDEYTFDENQQVHSHTITKLKYVIAIADCMMDEWGGSNCLPPAAFLSGVERINGLTNEVLSTTQITGANSAIVDLGDGLQFPIYFNNLREMIEQIKNVEKHYELLRNAVIADLVRTFGITAEELQQWIKDGLVKININRQNLSVDVLFDESLQGLRRSNGEVNPLGDFVIPASIQYRYEHTTWDPMILEANSSSDAIRPVHQPLIRGFKLTEAHVLYAERQEVNEWTGEKLGIKEIHLEYTPGGLLKRVLMLDGPQYVCFGPGCEPPGRVVKEIIYSRPDPCTYGYYCIMVMPWKTAEIFYPNANAKGVARRVVDFNIWQQEKPFDSIHTVIEYDAKGVVLENYTFEYLTAEPGCIQGETCPSVTYLYKIVGLHSTIKINQKWPLAPGEYIAEVVFESGKTFKVKFESFEMLFNKVRKYASIQPGDVNGNGRWDVQDLELIKKHLKALKKGQPSRLTLEQFALADVDGDGEVTWLDLRNVEGLVAGNLTLEDVPMPLEVIDFDGDDELTWADNQIVIALQNGRLKANQLPVKLGDLSGSGKLTTADIKILNEYLAGDRKLTPLQMLLADLNGDGKVSVKDKNILKQLVAGTITYADLPLVELSNFSSIDPGPKYELGTSQIRTRRPSTAGLGQVLERIAEEAERAKKRKKTVLSPFSIA